MDRELRRLARFGLVGVVNTSADALVFSGLAALGLAAAPAQGAGYAAGVATSWLLNSRWVFGAGTTVGTKAGEPPRSQPAAVLRFLAVNGASALATALAMQWLSRRGAAPLWAAKTAVTLLGMAMNYSLYRFWVFRTRTRPPRLAHEDGLLEKGKVAKGERHG